MKGHVPTPDDLAETMVRRLFRDKPPTRGDRILYPGCGTGPFAAAVERICESEHWELPEGVGIESDPELVPDARNRELDHLEVIERDFLALEMIDVEKFDYIIGNPPYVPIEGLEESEKERYKSEFQTAVGRFDLYLLFFERALQLLDEDGLLSFVTPEKFEYVDTASPLRKLLTRGEWHVEEIEHIDENAFTGLVTFPCVTTVRNGGRGTTKVTLRNGQSHTTTLPQAGESWASSIRGADLADLETGVTLGDVTTRISPGVATGADSVFVMNRAEVPGELENWARPTVSGRQLREFEGARADSVFICPYQDDGRLMKKDELGSFGEWAEQHRERLESRSCVEKGGKDWYAWHETPPMNDLLGPKIVFRDIAKTPQFWAEREGDVIPRHTVYYAIPKQGVPFDGLLDYLNSQSARRWIRANCQKAHNGYLRLQSRVLTDLPVPLELADTYQATIESSAD